MKNYLFYFVCISYLYVTINIGYSQVDTTWYCGTRNTNNYIQSINSNNALPCFDRCLPEGSIPTALVFIDFTSGRTLQSGYMNQPQTISEVYDCPDKDAIGNLGWETVTHNYLPFKYSYINYWSKYFGSGICNSYSWTDDSNNPSCTEPNPHPDYDYWISLYPQNPQKWYNVLVRGSLAEYFSEISSGCLTIQPTVLHPNMSDPYKSGIVNNTFSTQNDPYSIDWIVLDTTKAYYRKLVDSLGYISGFNIFTTNVITKLRILHQNNQISFNVDDFIQSCGRLIVVYAGYSLDTGSPTDIAVDVVNDIHLYNGSAKYVICTYEKSTKIDLNPSTCILRGIGSTAHEYGHTFGWHHGDFTSTEGPVDLMTGDSKIDNNCPAHVNPIIKLLEGWVDPIVITQSQTQSVYLLPIEFGTCQNKPQVVVVPIYPIHSSANDMDYCGDRYFVIEKRSRVKFDRYIGGGGEPNGNPLFLGGFLIHEWLGDPFTGLSGEFAKLRSLISNISGPYYGDPAYFYGNTLTNYDGHNFSIMTSPPSWSSGFPSHTDTPLITGIDCSNMQFLYASSFNINTNNYNISSNKTWSDKLFTLHSITVDNNVTLTLTQNTTFGFGRYLDPETKLIVNGNLVADNVRFTNRQSLLYVQPYTAANNWDGISFSQTNSLLSHLTNCTIEGANIGIKTDKAQPTITSCTTKTNNTGIYVISNSPFLTNNYSIDNTQIGLYGQWMSTEVTGNHFGMIGHPNGWHGALLDHCGNVWYKNKCDYNLHDGLLAFQYVTNDYNRTSGNPYNPIDCGNGMRHNGIFGVESMGYSNLHFNTYNSVWDNAITNPSMYYDLYADDVTNCSIDGSGNFSDLTTMNGANVQWNLPIDHNQQDPVSFMYHPQILTNMSDSQLVHYAKTKRLSGNYSDAVLALKELHGRGWNGSRALKGAVIWYQVLNDAEFNSPNNDPISTNIQASKEDFYDHMTNNIPVHVERGRRLRQLAASKKAYSKNYDDAIALLDPIIQHANSDYEKQQALFDKLLCEFHGKKNLQNATSVYQSIINIDSTTKHAFIAKWLLGFPVTTAQMKAAFGYPNNPSPPIIQDLKDNPSTKDYDLYQNYPNPFGTATISGNLSTQISYSIPSYSNVKLSVMDMLGRELSVLVNENKQQGFYSASFNAKNYPSGIYYYRLIAGKTIITKKMTLVK